MFPLLLHFPFLYQVLNDILLYVCVKNVLRWPAGNTDLNKSNQPAGKLRAQEQLPHAHVSARACGSSPGHQGDDSAGLPGGLPRFWKRQMHCTHPVWSLVTSGEGFHGDPEEAHRGSRGLSWKGSPLFGNRTVRCRGRGTPVDLA